MADRVTTSVTTASDATVTIAVEKYHELLAQAAQKPPVIHRIIHKTPEMSVQEHKAWGVTCMGLGSALLVVGALRFRAGVTQAAKLK